MTYYPTPEQVAIAWLGTVPGVPVGKIATTLPGDTSTWSTDGFLTVLSVGGSGPMYTGLRSPVVQVDAWANNPDSSKPPWGKAGSLIGAVIERTLTDTQPGELFIRAGFYPVRLMSVYPLGEPRRVPDDESSFARYQVDLTFRYALNPD
jgi:hypothetical protein